MEGKELVYLLTCFAVLMTGAVCLTYQIYRIVQLDAASRGLKRPRLWGLLAIGGNNSSGLLCYLIGRRNYPVVDLPQERRTEIQRRKLRAFAGLCFLVVGSIGLVLVITVM